MFLFANGMHDCSMFLQAFWIFVFFVTQVTFMSFAFVFEMDRFSVIDKVVSNTEKLVANLTFMGFVSNMNTFNVPLESTWNLEGFVT